MDERVLGPTREAALEEITECRQKMGTLLVIYFIVILLLVLYGGGNLLFLIVVAAAGGGCAWGKILYVALPMFLWFYSQGANTSGRILMLYSVRSEAHTSELQSQVDLVCRLLLEKKKNH